MATCPKCGWTERKGVCTNCDAAVPQKSHRLKSKVTSAKVVDIGIPPKAVTRHAVCEQVVENNQTNLSSSHTAPSRVEISAGNVSVKMEGHVSQKAQDNGYLMMVGGAVLAVLTVVGTACAAVAKRSR